MFIRNKYYRIYKQIINVYRYNIITDVYCESHHIHPKSMGGTDRIANIISVPYRIHYILHKLLTKFTTNKNKMKMCWALHTFFHFNIQRQKNPDFISYTITNSRKYENHKKILKISLQNRIPHTHSTLYTFKNKKTNEIITKTKSEFKKYSHLSDQEICHLVKERHKTLKGWGILRENGEFSCDIPLKPHKILEKKLCHHCNKYIDPCNYSRWHGNNCKVIDPLSFEIKIQQIKNIRELK